MTARGIRRGPVVAIVVIGVGLVAAPVAFQMFSRAPRGGDMIDDFRPYMTDEVIDRFRDDVALIGAAQAEADQELRALLADAAVVADADFDERFGLVSTLHDEWPTIDADMSAMLDDVGDKVANFEAVDALPPFALFPWFFVVPGSLVAVVAVVVLRGGGSGHVARRGLWVLGGLGVAIAAAPAVFQMFTRAPQGSQMIDTFRPIMAREHIRDLQGYFVTIGSAEGQLRVGLLPLVRDAAGLTEDELAALVPAVQAFHRDWPEIVAADTGFAAMVGAMSDNVDNYRAVDALPPFWLFPWFFVVPGTLVVALAFAARPRGPAPAPHETPAAGAAPEPPVPQRSER